MQNNSSKSIRFVFGPVSMVKAIPSREISVIYIEVPEERHVEVTNLLYGRDALITLSNIVGGAYGVLDPEIDELTCSSTTSTIQESSTESKEPIAAIHGCVSGVRAVLSRGVSIITIEVPEEAHVEVTKLLYGRDALVVAVNLGVSTPYGVVKNKGNTVHATNNRAGTASPFVSNPYEKNPQRSGLILKPPPLNLLKWIGARCSEEAFQDFLGVRNEAQAIEKVREICSIESRKELTTNHQAKLIFIKSIYNPYASRTRAPGVSV